jgi:plasmid stabilization system protein ParE
MNRFVLHPGAYADLTDIWEYIAADNLQAADRVIEKFTRRFRL